MERNPKNDSKGHGKQQLEAAADSSQISQPSSSGREWGRGLEIEFGIAFLTVAKRGTPTGPAEVSHSPEFNRKTAALVSAFSGTFLSSKRSPNVRGKQKRWTKKNIQTQAPSLIGQLMAVATP